MCIVKKRRAIKLEVNVRGEFSGWKVFNKVKSRLYRDWIGSAIPVNKKFYPQKKWINEVDFREKADKKLKKIYLSYNFGFHIFADRDDAIEWLEGHSVWSGNHIRKVKFRNIVAMGELSSGKAIAVATEIFILKTEQVK